MAVTNSEFWVVTRSGSLYQLLLTREPVEVGGEYIMLLKKDAQKGFDEQKVERCGGQENVRLGRRLVVSNIVSFFETDEHVCNTSYIVAIFETEREGLDCLESLSEHNRTFFESTWRDQTRVAIEKMKTWPIVEFAPGLDRWFEVPEGKTNRFVELWNALHALRKRLPF